MNMEGEVILVAIDASKEITEYALEWAASNVARARDRLILLALVTTQTCPEPSPNIRTHHHSRTSQFFSCLLRKLGIGQREPSSSRDDTAVVNRGNQVNFHRVHEDCLNMMHELCSAHDLTQVQTEVKLEVDSKLGFVASNAKELQATWVILDRHLKRESEYCLKQLKCNIVVVDQTIPKILKAVNLPTSKNLKSDETETAMLDPCPRNIPRSYVSITTKSSVDTESTIFDTDVPFSLSTPSTSNVIQHEQFVNLNSQDFNVSARESQFPSKFQLLDKPSNFIPGKSHPRLLVNPLYDKSSHEESSNASFPRAKADLKEFFGNIKQKSFVPPRKSADEIRSRKNYERNSLIVHESKAPFELASPTMNRTSSVRKAMSLYLRQPPNPPPLCSTCKHNAPIFGKAPRKFSFKEIERATNRFSQENFLAEGGFGPVHKGVLPDGQVVAVKQHKTMSAQGASEFCSEVEVLSCAQHRNLVMLVGYCTEKEWLLVYEFACNGSLDKHLYGKDSMSWRNRMKVAIGAARGLRYLHEDCRVGCIVHRDFRPNNILLTHDFEPMVGDFGLARWQVDGQSAEETRVIGALGYLAPEYTLSGLITEKADVYAFGVVLLELLSGFNVTEFSRKTGQQFVSEWGYPLLESMNINGLIDPLLKNNCVWKEVECMMVAARLCISPNPDQRPRMSKVLKILEGDVLTDMASDERKRSSVGSMQNTSFRSPSNMMELKKATYTTPVRLSERIKTPSKVNASEEYQVYLHNSLAKFFQNRNGN